MVVTFLVLVGVFAVPAIAEVTPPVPYDLNTVLTNIRNWIMGILGLLGTVFLTLAGARYLISNGDPGEISKAKAALKNAAWGYGLAALAPVIVQILKGIVGA
ncbi:hypothetical protein [Frankia nepalensis]|uniref:hypothetical protein n=1 Tax=Frankia nepalensis TaxID=1836974 RepID=UPI0027DBB78C|nr:hypothetical protein [Frankia nepalensis]